MLAPSVLPTDPMTPVETFPAWVCRRWPWRSRSRSIKSVWSSRTSGRLAVVRDWSRSSSASSHWPASRSSGNFCY